MKSVQEKWSELEMIVDIPAKRVVSARAVFVKEPDAQDLWRGRPLGHALEVHAQTYQVKHARPHMHTHTHASKPKWLGYSRETGKETETILINWGLFRFL